MKVCYHSDFEHVKNVDRRKISVGKVGGREAYKSKTHAVVILYSENKMDFITTSTNVKLIESVIVTSERYYRRIAITS